MDRNDRLSELNERAVRLREQIQDLQAELIGVESRTAALLRMGDAPYASRTEEVFRFLQSMTGPCKVAEIVEHLQRLGGDDESSEKVSSTLNHLRKQGRVESVSHGLWRAVD